jgi:hypothetical protein
MARIAVDIDSTLFDFETPAREAFLQMASESGDKSLFRGAYVPWTEWRSPADVCGLDNWKEAIARCHKPDVILAQTPFQGAVETCRALIDEGHDLLYISNRDPEATESTQEWLQITGFIEPGDGEAARLLCLHGDKRPHISTCQYLIDDRPKTLVEFVTDPNWRNKLGLLLNWGSPNYDLERKGFGLMYEYNRALTDISNIYLAPTWSGLNYYLVRKGILSEPALLALEVG